MTEATHRPTVAKISLNAIVKNYHNLKQYLPKGTKIYSILKSNAYGYGAVPVAQALSEAKADAFGVAVFDEALELRQAGIEEPILILGLSYAAMAEELAQLKLTPTIWSMDWLKEAKRKLIDHNTKEVLTVQLNFDSGMNRTGVKTVKEGQAIVDYLAENKAHFHLESIYSHYATTDSLDDYSQDKLNEQMSNFENFKENIDLSEFNHTIEWHQSNSALSLRHPDFSLDAVRLGAVLFGLSPFEEPGPLPLELTPALEIETEIIAIKRLEAGETVSYGAAYESYEGEWIATIPIGYGDGWLRQYIGQNTIVGGEFAPTVGRICMDQTMISLNREVPMGSKVTLIGKQANKVVTAEEIADNSGTINTELTNIIGLRIPRVYV